MKTFKTECDMCGEEITYLDPTAKPVTCHKRICVTNKEYQRRHRDPEKDYQPSAEEIRKW